MTEIDQMITRFVGKIALCLILLAIGFAILGVLAAIGTIQEFYESRRAGE